MYLADNVLSGFLDAFHAQKNLADKAIAQVSDSDLRRPLDENTNSVAIIMKHVAGNLASRFTDFLTTDGEKPWRDRDAEFTDTFRDRSEVLASWESGWNVLFETFASLRPEHMDWQIFIRGESYYVPAALARSLAHTSYHVGQIVLTSRLMCKTQWQTITIPRGQSRQFNTSIGFGTPEMPAQ
jgi:hypothetical protein